MVIVVPTCSVLWAEMLPPWAMTICLVIARPKPLPPLPRVRERSAR